MERPGADFVDLCELTARQMKEFYFVTDGHLNARGHAYLGEVLKEWARDQLAHDGVDAGIDAQNE